MADLPHPVRWTTRARLRSVTRASMAANWSSRKRASGPAIIERTSWASWRRSDAGGWSSAAVMWGDRGGGRGSGGTTLNRATVKTTRASRYDLPHRAPVLGRVGCRGRFDSEQVFALTAPLG